MSVNYWYRKTLSLRQIYFGIYFIFPLKVGGCLEAGVVLTEGFDGSYNILVCLSVEALDEDGHDKEVDEEGDKERDGGLGEEVHVGLLHLLLLLTVHVSWLKENWKKCLTTGSVLNLLNKRSLLNKPFLH